MKNRSIIVMDLFICSVLIILPLCGSGCARSNCIQELRETFSIATSNFANGTKVNLCKAGQSLGKQDVTLHADSQYGFYSESHNRASRYDGSCSDGSRAKFDSVPVALTSDSFTHFKLCYLDTYKTDVVLLSPADDCPSDSIQQKVAVDDCSQIMSL